MLKFASPGMRGVPDDIIIWPHGVVHFIEFKKPGEVLRDEQGNVCQMLVNAGAHVVVIDTLEQVVSYIEKRF